MRVLVTGAASQVGRFLIPALVSRGHECLCVSRHRHQNEKGVSWIEHDLKGMSDGLYSYHADAWIHIAPMDLLPPLLPLSARMGIRHIIAFSSTSIYTKQVRSTAGELSFIRRVIDAEGLLEDYAIQHDIAWNIFRPTLIYSGQDKNVSFIARMVRRFGFFPLVGDGRRQPVHAADLAQACVDVLGRKEAVNHAFNMGGGEVLPYSEMVRRIFAVQGVRPRLIRIHPALVRWMITLLRLWPPYRYLTVAMVDRMTQDMVFDYSEAHDAFGYTPRSFVPPGGSASKTASID